MSLASFNALIEHQLAIAKKAGPHHCSRTAGISTAGTTASRCRCAVGAWTPASGHRAVAAAGTSGKTHPRAAARRSTGRSQSHAPDRENLPYPLRMPRQRHPGKRNRTCLM